MRHPSDAGSLPPKVMYQHAELTPQCFLFATFAKGFADTIKLTGSQLDILFNNGTHVITALVEDLPTPAFQAIFEAYFIFMLPLTNADSMTIRRPHFGSI